MAIEVELPDGSVVEFPEGTDNATMERALAQYASPKPSFSGVQGTPTSEVGPLSGAGGASVDYQPGMGRVRGAVGEQDAEAEAANRAQMFQGLPAPARVAIGAGSSVARLGRGVAQIAGLPVDESRSRQIDEAMRGDNAATAGRIGMDVGMAAVPLSRIGGLTKAGQYASSAVAGSALGGLQPVTDDESRTQNVALGGAFGALGQGASNLLVASGKRAAQAITPELRALHQRAKDFGINLTPAQLSDSELMKRVVGMFEKMPFSGAASRAKAQNDAGNSALGQVLGLRNGEGINAQTFDRALTEIGGKFDDAFAGGMTYGRDFLRDIAVLKKEAAEQLDDTAVRTINGLVERVRKQGAGGQMSGRTLQSLDRKARTAATGGGDRQSVAQEFRTALHDAFGKNAPAGKRELWNEARTQYAKAMQILPLVAKNPEGGVPLSQLQNIITATGAGKRARARGRDGDMGTLASIGQLIKGQTSSGTAENALASQVLNPLAWPVIAASALIGRTGNGLLNNSTLARLMMREGRGQTRQALAPLARAGAVGAAPATQQRPDESRKRK